MNEKNREILLLYNNGTLKTKKEVNIKKKDFIDVKYVAINTSSSNDSLPRNFFINKFSSLFYFDKAYIEYQLMIYSNYEYDSGIPVEEVLEPVRLETEYISDLLTLINCIDRLNVVNNLICNIEKCGETEHIEIAYFGIKLVKDNKEIYNKHYQYKPTSLNKYYSYRILKHFKELYSINMIPDLFRSNEFIIINDDMTWSISNKISKKGLIGVPLIWSNTITFCTKSELKLFKDCRAMFCTHCIIDGNIDSINIINNYIEKGKYREVEDYTSNLEFLSQSYTDIPLIRHNKYVYLDILSHLAFILSMTDIVFDSLYNSSVNEDHENDSIVMSILSIIFHFKDNIKKEIYFTSNSVISLSQFFNILTN